MNGDNPDGRLAGSVAASGSPPGTTLAWAPPRLSAPIVINVATGRQSLNLDSARDYRIVLPSSPLSGPGGLTIAGGHNVVLIGGEIRVPTIQQAPDPKQRRGLYLKGQTGTVHIEGLHITGTDLAEGIDLDQRFGATVQLENIRIERTRGSYQTNHADVIQAWAGPAVLRLDRLTGSTDYQGFFLLPRQHFDGAVGTWDLRRVDLTGAAGSGYLLWRGANDSMISRDVYIQAEDRSSGKLFWPTLASWPGVTVGSSPGGEFVPPGVAGIGYASPGYGGQSGAMTQPQPGSTGGTARPAGEGTNTSVATPTSPAAGMRATAGAVPVCGSTAQAPAVYQHVVWIWMQNKRYTSVVGDGSAPYVNRLAAACGLATDYASQVHRSLPNALAATSGGTQGVTTNSAPAAFRIDVDNIFRQVRAAGGTARSYVEGMSRNCVLDAAGLYDPKHNPAAYFTGSDDRAACLRDDVPFARFTDDLAASALPTFSFISPDLCNSTHDCPVETGDRWLQEVVGAIARSRQYASGSMAVVIAWDEGGDATGLRTPLLVMAPSVTAGVRIDGRFDHYSLLRTTENMLGLPYLGGAAQAAGFRGPFHL
jgi:hypothetical protein